VASTQTAPAGGFALAAAPARRHLALVGGHGAGQLAATPARAGNLHILPARYAPRRNPALALKYEIDRAFAGVLLLALAPIMITVAALVKLTSSGPVLFRQTRVGAGGKTFDVLKFRTMRPASAGAKFTPEQGMTPGGVELEDRRTLVGRWLRRSFLDELPQLVNVLRGDMSLVGPRPERPEYVEMFCETDGRYGLRHRVRGGITGLAQVRGMHGQCSLAGRIELDNRYIDSWSLLLDLKILISTVFVVLRLEGE
jgi:lipopolysaccharide/colanic/teichoic acid biosynthesis glycosyltransferase